MITELLDALPHFVVSDGMVTKVGPEVDHELDCDATPLLGTLVSIGTRLDDADWNDLLAGRSALRVRLGPTLRDRPVRLRRILVDGDRAWVEVRSLANEFRLEALLRRSGFGHMLISPTSWVHWAVSSNELLERMPGDDPIKWVELMHADDMQAIALAVHEVAEDPTVRRTVTHRLLGDDDVLVVDTIESVMFDPDLRAVLMRSQLRSSDVDEPSAPPPADGATGAPWAGVSVSDHLPIGVAVASRAGKVLHRNAEAAEFLGLRAGDALLPDRESAWALDQLEIEQTRDFVDVIRGAAQGVAGFCTIPSPIAGGRWLRVSASPSAGLTMVVTIEDMTGLVEAERRLRESNRLLEALDAHSEDLVMVFDTQGASRYTSSSVLDHLGDDVTVQHADDFLPFVHPPDRPLVDGLIDRIRQQSGASESVQFRIDVGGDVGRWHQATMTNLLDDADVRGFVVTLRDVHERYVVERDLQFRATHDALTTLPDRAALQARLEAILTESHLGGHRTALIFCDIDHFKSINDRAGHHGGDLVLTEVAERLRSALRSSDVVGRFGGDEFVVVVPNVDDEDHALSMAQRIFDAVTGPAMAGVIEVDIAVSMGVAVSDDESTSASVLLQRADLAMYEAKGQGRGRLSLFVPADDGGQSERDTIRADLRGAIDERRLTVHYQPIVPLQPELEGGLEAFVRWEHDALGLIEAKRFIGIAEGAGLMVDLGGALIELVGRDVGDRDDFVCLNLSPAQIAHPDAADVLLAQLAAAGLPPERVVVEVTEAAIAQEPGIRVSLAALRASGVRVFLDDFGIGYSSLGHLNAFPVDALKIDAAVVFPEVDERLVRMIVSVAGALGVRTIAEGVETEAQLDMVTHLGVDYAQGYLIGRPTRDLGQVG